MRILHSFPTRRSSDLILNTTILSESWFAANKNWPSGEIAKLRGVRPPVSVCPSTESRPVSAWIENPVKLSCPRLETYRSEEHTSELQSRGHLVCRLLL